MSDERLNELGIPRRAFLKRAIGTAFVAPVVISFGLGGIAEASATSFPNMCFGNQGDIEQAERALNALVLTISGLQDNGSIAPGGIAQSLLSKIIEADTALEAGDFATACGALGALQNELAAQSGQHIDAGAAADLSSRVSFIQREVGCDCSAS